jgi:hypothetical protein
MATTVTKPIILDETGNKIVDAMGNIVTSLNDLKKIQLANNAGAHNGLYRGKDLSNTYTDTEIYDMISTGDLSDLYVGDYFKKSITSTIGGTEDIDVQIAGFNCYYNVGDTALTRNHAVVVTKDCVQTLAQMHITSSGAYESGNANTTVGGYVATDMYKTTLPAYANALQQAIGSTHIISRRALLTTGINDTDQSAGIDTGRSNAWSWYDELVGLMTEAEVYGAPVFSSSGYDTGEACIQLPLFALNPSSRVAGKGRNGSRQWYWLRSIANSTFFCCVSTHGLASYADASHAGGVRLRFLIG